MFILCYELSLCFNGKNAFCYGGEVFRYMFFLVQQRNEWCGRYLCAILSLYCISCLFSHIIYRRLHATITRAIKEKPRNGFDQCSYIERFDRGCDSHGYFFSQYSRIYLFPQLTPAGLQRLRFMSSTHHVRAL